MIDLTFRNINRIFVVSFKNANRDTIRDYFNKYYMLLVEIKDFNVLIYNKTFFLSASKKQIWWNGDHNTGIFLDYLYHQNYKTNRYE